MRIEVDEVDLELQVGRVKRWTWKSSKRVTSSIFGTNVWLHGATFRYRSTPSLVSFTYHRDTQSNGGAKKEVLSMGFYTAYYAVGFPTFLVVLVTLYLLFTGKSLLFCCARLFVLVSRVRTGRNHWIMLILCKNYRIGRGFQCWPLPRGDKSIYMGFNGYWIVHWVECIRSGLVSAFALCGKLMQSQSLKYVN